MQVVAGPRSPRLAAATADALAKAGHDADLVVPEVDRFPDGEAYVRVAEDLGDADVALVQSAASDEAWIELLLLEDAVGSWTPREVACVVPYLGYARQDRRFEEGEALSAEVMARAVGFGATTVLTVDPHEDRVVEFFPCPARALSAVPVLADALADRGVDLVLAPDEGAAELAKRTADAFGADADHLVKERLSGEEVHVEPGDVAADGRTCALVDDIISTGGTMATAARALLDAGAAEVLCAATHGLFADVTRDDGTVVPARDRLLEAGVAEVLVTDTVERPGAPETGVVSVAPVVAEAVGELFA